MAAALGGKSVATSEYQTTSCGILARPDGGPFKRHELEEEVRRSLAQKETDGGRRQGAGSRSRPVQNALLATMLANTVSAGGHRH